jgi:hypothetical protein
MVIIRVHVVPRMWQTRLCRGDDCHVFLNNITLDDDKCVVVISVLYIYISLFVPMSTHRKQKVQ